MTIARQELGSPTGTSVGLGHELESQTRTISDVVDEAGFLKNWSKILVEDATEVQQSTEDLHLDSLVQLHRTMAQDLTKQGLSGLLNRLSKLGLSWREIARVSSVSVPAVRKWRNGEPATGENRMRVAMVSAFCELVEDQYMIDDVAGWSAFFAA